MRNLILTAGLCLITMSLASSTRLVCHYGSWSKYITGKWNFKISYIDPTMCTHLIFDYAWMNGRRMVPWFSDHIDDYASFNQLKTGNADLKTLLAVPTSSGLGNIASEDARKTFTRSAIDMLRNYGFDGLDLQVSSIAKDTLTLLLQELQKAFRNETEVTGNPRLLLTASVSAHKERIDNSYDIPEISKYLNFINVMTFQFVSGFESAITGHHSPLYKRSTDTGDSEYLNTAFAMEYWRDQGAPVAKLNMGFATSGTTFTLSTSNSDVGAPISGPGQPGEYTVITGLLSHFEICDKFDTEASIWIEEQKVPYATVGNQWVGFDDSRSISAKVTFLKEKSFGGVSVWFLNLDDFTGDSCDQGSFPLIRELHNLLLPDPTTTTTSPTTTTTTITHDPNFCIGKERGTHTFVEDPSRFYNCWDDRTYVQDCPAGLVYNHACRCCDWPN